MNVSKYNSTSPLCIIQMIFQMVYENAYVVTSIVTVCVLRIVVLELTGRGTSYIDKMYLI